MLSLTIVVLTDVSVVSFLTERCERCVLTDFSQYRLTGKILIFSLRLIFYKLQQRHNTLVYHRPQIKEGRSKTLS